MKRPPLVFYPTVEEYREHFVRVYCRGSITTFDAIPVRFRRGQFDHCFYESTRRDGRKDAFSLARARRIDWIRATLEDPRALLYQGWDSRKKRYDGARRVCHCYDDYVVVIQLREDSRGRSTASFRTAFCADNSIERIIRSPLWKAGR